MTTRHEFEVRSEELAAASPSGWKHTGPWICAQRWEQVLSLHWPVSHETALRLVPAALELDTYNDQAYVSLLSLRMARVHLRDVIPIPDLSNFPELNVRTYVVHNGKPGVWFVSLDAPSHLNVWIGRHVFHLAYDSARMAMTDVDGLVTFSSNRGSGPARFSARYELGGGAAPAPQDSLESFLTERYCMYTVNHAGELLRADIEHLPWQLRPVDVALFENTTLQGDGLEHLGGPPSCALYADAVENVAWLPVRAT
jgi:uncharacterized protein